MTKTNKARRSARNLNQVMNFGGAVYMYKRQAFESFKDSKGIDNAMHLAIAMNLDFREIPDGFLKEVVRSIRRGFVSSEHNDVQFIVDMLRSAVSNGAAIPELPHPLGYVGRRDARVYSDEDTLTRWKQELLAVGAMCGMNLLRALGVVSTRGLSPATLHLNGTRVVMEGEAPQTRTARNYTPPPIIAGKLKALFVDLYAQTVHEREPLAAWVESKPAITFTWSSKKGATYEVR